ncbi:MAG: hypothetical protein ACXWQ5_00785 [Ktedonobacterales bacterium]
MDIAQPWWTPDPSAIPIFLLRVCKKSKVRALLHFGDSEWPACAPNIPAE